VRESVLKTLDRMPVSGTAKRPACDRTARPSFEKAPPGPGSEERVGGPRGKYQASGMQPWDDLALKKKRKERRWRTNVTSRVGEGRNR